MALQRDNSENINAFILEEFRHAGAYVLQLINDRATIFTLYIALCSLLATIIGFLIKQNADLSSLSVYLPYVILLFGIIHLLFFLRMGHTEKKYNTYLLRMDSIRNFYKKLAGDSGNMYKNIETVIPAIIQQRKPGVIYPLYTGTMIFSYFASFCFGVAVFLLWKNILFGIIVFFIAYGSMYLIAKAKHSQ